MRSKPFEVDSRGYKESKYNVFVGYQTLLFPQGEPPKSKLWRIIWLPNSIPNFFLFLFDLNAKKHLNGGKYYQ